MVDDQKDPDFWKEKGNGFYKQKNYNEAINCFTTALKIDSKYAPAWNNLSLALRKIGKNQEAQECQDYYNKLVKERSRDQLIKKTTDSKEPPKKINSDLNKKTEVEKSSIFSIFSVFLPSIFKGGGKDTRVQSKPQKRAESITPTSKADEDDDDISYYPQNQPAVQSDTSQVNIPSRFEISWGFENIEDLAEQEAFPSNDDLIFAGLGNTIRVGPYQITDPLAYWSDGTSGDASCINIQLPIGVEVSEERRALPYYPQYSQISPDQRAELSFMASSRKENRDLQPGICIYLFLWSRTTCSYRWERCRCRYSRNSEIIGHLFFRRLCKFLSTQIFDLYLRIFPQLL